MTKTKAQISVITATENFVAQFANVETNVANVPDLFVTAPTKPDSLRFYQDVFDPTKTSHDTRTTHDNNSLFSATNDQQRPNKTPAPRNPLSGCKRRQTRHYTSPKRRVGSLSVLEYQLLEDVVDFSNLCVDCIQVGILLMCVVLLRRPWEPQWIRRCYSRALLPWIQIWMITWLIMLYYDAAIGDIPYAEEHARIHHNPEKFHRINDFMDDDQAEGETNFRRDELYRFLLQLDLPQYVSVPRPPRFDGRPMRYWFEREELLLFTLMKFKSGKPTTTMCKDYGWKSDTRIGAGFKWFLKYLDDRYDHLIGNTGLLLWRDRFPYFAEKIRGYIAGIRESINPLTGLIQIRPHVWFNPGAFNVTGFVDCKNYQICRPHSGPAGNYPGAQRRPWWDIVQRALWDGHHRHHAIKMLTFLLPNGMYAAVWGPASARRHDSRLVHWSAVDQILVLIQATYLAGVLYCFYGDFAFKAVHWICIRACHKRQGGGGPPLTQRQREEDKVMSSARERIEHSYGLLAELFRIVDARKEIKLEKDPIHALRMVRMAHFFFNVRTCLRGNNVGSRRSFDCDPPTLENYLAGRV